jgi:ectoine hydroxylase-related dioxygenase (phytanoyl-CoA dioxygenase family)
VGRSEDIYRPDAKLREPMPDASALHRLSDTERLVRDFQADGAVLVRGLFSPEEVALAREGIEANLADPSPRAAVASRADDTGRFFEDFCNWTRIEAYARLIALSPAAEMAQRLMRARTVRFYHDHLLVKEAATRQSTPWHQDQPYYNIEGNQACSLWMPVDPVPVESSLRFVAGSHRGPWLMPRTFMDQQSRWFPEGSLADLPDIDADPHAHRILTWALEPGDAIFFHMLALHSAGGAVSRRRVLSLRFMGDDVVHAPRAWKTSPDFPGLDSELPAGHPMDHPLFPVVWPRATF